MLVCILTGPYAGCWGYVRARQDGRIYVEVPGIRGAVFLWLDEEDARAVVEQRAR